MRAGRDPVRQADAADRPGGDVLGVDQHAFGQVRRHVGDEADQIAVILVDGADARRERGLRPIAVLAEAQALRGAGLQVVLDDAGEQESDDACGWKLVCIEPSEAGLIFPLSASCTFKTTSPGWGA